MPESIVLVTAIGSRIVPGRETERFSLRVFYSQEEFKSLESCRRDFEAISPGFMKWEEIFIVHIPSAYSPDQHLLKPMCGSPATGEQIDLDLPFEEYAGGTSNGR